MSWDEFDTWMRVLRVRKCLKISNVSICVEFVPDDFFTLNKLFGDRQRTVGCKVTGTFGTAEDAAACPQRTVSGGTGHAGIQCDLIELVPVSLFQVVIQRIKAFVAPADGLGRSVFLLHIISAL